MHGPIGARFGEGGSDRERVFRAAARHSRFVRFCRGAIPVTLIVIMGTVGGIAYLKPRLLEKLSVDPTKLVLSGTKITMEAPRLGGYTRDGRPYDLTARAAAQDLTNPDVLELTDLHARVTMQDKSTVELKAATGVYQTKLDSMQLQTDIVVTSSTGYSAWLSEAAVDMKKNTIVSDKPVKVKMTSGTVDGNHLDVTNGGELIHFDKGVEMNVVPQHTPASAPKPSGTPNALQGFSVNRNQPVKIDAVALDVRDRDKRATFTGDVVLVQGDTTMRSKTLVVSYNGDPMGNGTAKGATPSAGPDGSSQIRHMEAKGGVVVTQKDESATGDSAIYDTKDNTVRLFPPPGGQVTVTRGPNIVKGQTLVVHLDTGVSHFEGGVEMTAVPQHGASDPAAPAAPSKGR